MGAKIVGAVAIAVIAVFCFVMAIPFMIFGGLPKVQEANGQFCYVPDDSGIPQGVMLDNAPLTQEQMTNALLIVAAGKEHPDPRISGNPRAWIIAVATAMQESRLRVVDYGDAAGPDSRGLFQQRDSWGPYEVRMDPKGSSTLFYNALLKVDDWDRELGDVAYDVQHFKNGLQYHYTEKEPAATQIVAAAGGITCGNGGVNVEIAINAALKYVPPPDGTGIPTPYVWQGGNVTGPTAGLGQDPDPGPDPTVGFDGGGLVLHAYSQVGIMLPREPQKMWTDFKPSISKWEDLERGDIVFLSNDGTPAGIDHVGIYMGGFLTVDSIIEASPESGFVQVTKFAVATHWKTEFIGALRPGGGSDSPGLAAGGEWVNPVPGARISSSFGPRDGGFHYGVDLAAPAGTPMYAVGAGHVVYAGPASGFGNAVYIQHDNGDVTVYGHQTYNTVATGDHVTAGQQIAVVGSEGDSDGPHLHLEVHVGGKDGERIDPVPWLKQRGVEV